MQDGQRAGQYSTLQKRFGTRKKQKNNLAETARQDRFAQSTDVYAVKASNYKGLRRGSPVYCRNNWHIHHAKSGGGQILICVAGRGFYQEWGRAAVELLPGDTVFCGGVYVAKNTSQSASLLEQKNQVRFRT